MELVHVHVPTVSPDSRALCVESPKVPLHDSRDISLMTDKIQIKLGTPELCQFTRMSKLGVKLN
jgi:hypothetical protein